MTYNITYKGVDVEVRLGSINESGLIETRVIAATIHGRWMIPGLTSIEFSKNKHMAKSWAENCYASFIRRNPESEWK